MLKIKIFFLLFILTLTSCMPKSSVRVRSTSNNTGNNSGTPTSGLNLQTQWYSSSSYSNSLTVYNALMNDVFLRGNDIHNYLNSLSDPSSAQLCLVMNFSNVLVAPGSYAPRQLRVRAQYMQYYNSTISQNEKLLKFDFSDTLGNSLSCEGNQIIDSTTYSFGAGNVKYDIGSVCPLCSTTLNSVSIDLFSSNFTGNSGGQNHYSIGSSLNLSLSQLSLGISLNGSGGSPGSSTCDASNCNGTKCCLSNQCVQHGAQKLSAISSDPTGWAPVNAILYPDHPELFINYPQYFYVCPNLVTPPPPPPPGGIAGVPLSTLVQDYACLNDLETQATDYPYVSHLPTTSPSSCISNMTDVLTRMVTVCGCSTASSPAWESCLYKYKIKTTDSLGNPTQMECTPLTPPNTTGDQLLTLSSRTAPHRYFDSTGVFRSKLSVVPSGENVEGADFYYLDPLTKTFPQNGSLNMNSLLGNFSLTEAQPALMVNVSIGTSYIVKPQNGLMIYYNHCPDCAYDAWNNALKAFPGNLINGWGLTAQGFGTQRETNSHNFSGANYEDAIFGRACWLPPTMLPFSHYKNADLQTQRMNRLQTQAALYVNGYQRDWNGFNKGALIGSFDGVNWFAIGTGRILSAPTNKLFLAINAPFADLANTANYQIEVRPSHTLDSGADTDYDPTLLFTHPNQNKGATCQAWHQCSVDSDCITKLGWEYVCATVSNLKTAWPKFDTNANEFANQERILGVTSLLQGSILPGTSKRCVYRGAGAPCATNLASITTAAKRKVLACAPNFYCAPPSANVFNTEVARFGTAINNLFSVTNNDLIGRDANQLGRPLNYLGAGASLSSITTNLSYNIAQIDATASAGICRPGKAVASVMLNTSSPSASLALDAYINPLNQHSAMDLGFRTDYISQIGSLDYSNNQNTRYISCPVLDDSGNYIFTQDTFVNDASGSAPTSSATYKNYVEKSIVQNISLFETKDGSLASPFALIEGNILSPSAMPATQTFAKNACFRRAGAVCQTDFDCLPNTLSASKALAANVSFFGNLAEKKYWEEELVCGQAASKPAMNLANMDNFYLYDMGKNRCCREVGKTLTIYSKGTGISIDTQKFSYKNPTDTDRYSRLANVPSIDTDANTTNPKPLSATLSDILLPYQWKSIQKSAGGTCCGSHWIRKFADNTRNWDNPNRLAIDVQNFECLNYRIPNPSDNTHPEASLQCQDTSQTGITNPTGPAACAQTPIGFASGTTEPSEYSQTYSADIGLGGIPNVFAPSFFSYVPTVTSSLPYFQDFTGIAGAPAVVNEIRISIPTYCATPSTCPELQSVKVTAVQKYTIGTGWSGVSMINSLTPATSEVSCVNGGSTSDQCTYSLNAITKEIIIQRNSVDILPGEIERNYVTLHFEKTIATSSKEINPGNANYYLENLSKLELLGVPQMTFDPLVCTNDKAKLVPGIFATATLTDFNNPINSFSNTSAKPAYSGASPLKSTTQSGIDKPAVFKENEFMCCKELGSTTTDKNLCCSGFVVQPGGGTNPLFCALPATADLNVYFNRFISSEGSSVNVPAAGKLLETDFDPQTGAPKNNSSVNNKIKVLGQTYCEFGQVRQGSAFGYFRGQPDGPAFNKASGVYSIIDSSYDNNSATSQGATPELKSFSTFSQGFRWNNHYYCDYN